MKINISINGVLRNYLQKYKYHYVDSYLTTESEQTESEDNEAFKYGYNEKIRTINDFYFQSKDEQDVFTYIEFPLEIYGYAGLSNTNAMSNLNKVIFENKKFNFTLVGLDEYGKSKPSTLFFLSKNGFLGNNIKFITNDDIKKEWNNCDIWVTDDENIINKCPITKKCIKFNTEYNNDTTYINQINNINELNELCTKFMERNIISILTHLLKSAKYLIVQKMTSMRLMATVKK